MPYKLCMMKRRTKPHQQLPGLNTAFVHLSGLVIYNCGVGRVFCGRSELRTRIPRCSYTIFRCIPNRIIGGAQCSLGHEPSAIEHTFSVGRGRRIAAHQIIIIFCSSWKARSEEHDEFDVCLNMICSPTTITQTHQHWFYFTHRFKMHSLHLLTKLTHQNLNE